MSTEEQHLISNQHWQMVVSAIPEITQDTGEEDFRTLFSQFTVMAGDKLSAKGLYLVISGEVSLKLYDEELATASPLDYFYEEYLLLDELNLEVTAIALKDTELVFLSRKTWDTLTDEIKKRCLSVFFGDLVNIYQHEFHSC